VTYFKDINKYQIIIDMEFSVFASDAGGTPPTNSTLPVGDGGDKAMHEQTMDYFLMLWPLLATSGMAGSVIGLFYSVIHRI